MVEMLKGSLGKAEVKGDLRFQGGTEVSTNFIPWRGEAYGYKPLPTIYRADEPHSQVRPLYAWLPHAPFYAHLNLDAGHAPQV